MIRDPRDGSSIENRESRGSLEQLGCDGSTEDGMDFWTSEEEDDRGGDGGFDVFLFLFLLFSLLIGGGSEV